MDTIGPMAQTVSDLELLDRVITDTLPVSGVSLQGIRLGIEPYFMTNMDDDTADSLQEVLKKLRQAGIEVVSVEMPDLAELSGRLGFGLAVYEHYDSMTAYLKVK